MGPVARCAVQRGARRTMPSSSTTSTFLSTAPSDDGAAMSAESGGVAAAVWASFAGRVSEGGNRGQPTDFTIFLVLRRGNQSENTCTCLHLHLG